MSAEASAVLSESEYDNFCEFFYRKTGIRFSNQKRYFVDKRIADRITESGRGNFGIWFRSLRLDNDPEELQHLVDALTVNETYFYRETEQLDLLLGKILPEVLNVPGHPDEVRIWSMPCSSGEEPYSIALRLLEDWEDVDRYDISIFGTDIDSKMIQRARAGLYSERSVQKLGRSLRSRYFQQEKQGWRIVEELRSSIDFRRVN
ncbi:MAG: protein-glutamate O-methyltransferase CheR, partial [Myxococcota bacterium]